MPHTTDKRIRKEVGHLLYLPETGPLQVTGNRPTLDPKDRGQIAFQALLFGRASRISLNCARGRDSKSE